MKGFFVMALDGLRATEPLGRGLLLSEGLYLTNEISAVEPLSEEFQTLIGTLEVEHLRRSTALLHGSTGETTFENDGAAMAFLDTRLDLAHLFLTSLWFVKDNAVTFQLGFLRHPGPPGRWRVSSNLKKVGHTSSQGGRRESVFSAQELRAARKVYQSLSPGVPVPQLAIPTDSTRLQRAIYHLQTARSSTTVEGKLTQYVTAIEALFATSSTELTHRLAERVAVFLGDDTDSRVAIYETMKNAYAIRSSRVHGDRLKPKTLTSLPGLSASLDDFLRQSLLRILTDRELHELFNGKAELLDSYFVKRLFTGHAGPTS